MNFIQRRSQENFKSSGTGRRGISGFRMEDTNKKYHAKLISEVKIEPRVHYIKGHAPSLCNMIYFDKDDPDKHCEMCDIPHAKYKKQPAYLTRLYLAYIFELYKKKGTSKNGNEFEYDPFVVLSVPCGGKKMVNWQPFDNAADQGCLIDTYWVLENDKEQGFMVPQPVMNAKKLGEQFDLNLPNELVAKYSQEPDCVIHSMELSIYANVRWDHPDMIAAGLVNPYPADGEAKTSTKDEEQEAVTAGDLD